MLRSRGVIANLQRFLAAYHFGIATRRRRMHTMKQMRNWKR
jgi:hypothetical protein